MYFTLRSKSIGRLLFFNVSSYSLSLQPSVPQRKEKLPYPARVAWDPNFRERNKLSLVVRGFFYEGTGLFDGASEVEPHWLGLGDGHANW